MIEDREKFTQGLIDLLYEHGITIRDFHALRSVNVLCESNNTPQITVQYAVRELVKDIREPGSSSTPIDYDIVYHMDNLGCTPDAPDTTQARQARAQESG